MIYWKAIRFLDQKSSVNPTFSCEHKQFLLWKRNPEKSSEPTLFFSEPSWMELWVSMHFWFYLFFRSITILVNSCNNLIDPLVFFLFFFYQMHSKGSIQGVLSRKRAKLQKMIAIYESSNNSYSHLASLSPLSFFFSFLKQKSEGVGGREKKEDTGWVNCSL